MDNYSPSKRTLSDIRELHNQISDHERHIQHSGSYITTAIRQIISHENAIAKLVAEMRDIKAEIQGESNNDH